MFIILKCFDNLNEKYEKSNIYFFWILTFHFILNFNIFKCDDFVCKTHNDFSDSNCFNNIIKLDSKEYRAGEFVTTNDGQLIIEYSQDTTPGKGRLFYRLTSDGRGYYTDANPIKEFEMNTTYLATFKDQGDKKENISGRYEGRNILITLDGDSSGKQYLFSTSSWYSYTELYDLESDNYWTWFTTEFFEIPDNKYIFSFKYNLLKQPNSNNYFLVYIQYSHTTGSGDAAVSSSEYYAIKKFTLKLENGVMTKNITKTITNNNNYDNRVISFCKNWFKFSC